MTVASDDLGEAAQLISSGEFTRAIALLHAYTGKASARPDAVYMLAVAEFHTGDDGNAEAHFHVVLANGHEPANSAYHLGEIALKRHNRNLAACFYHGAIGFDPGHRGALDRLRGLAGPIQSAPPPPPPPQRPPTAADTAPAKVPPHPPRSARSVVGEVVEKIGPVAVPTMAGPATAQQLDIEVQVYDRSGRPEGRIALYLRGVHVKGSLSKGHWVELIEEPDAKGRVKRLLNLTTNKELSGKSSIFYPGS